MTESIHGKLSARFYDKMWKDQPPVFEITKQEMSALIGEWESLVNFKDRVTGIFKEICNDQQH